MSMSLLKSTCISTLKLEYKCIECFKALTYRLDWNNPEGDRRPFDLTKPLPLKGRPGRLTVAVEYFFNNDLEFLKSSDPEKTYTTSITKAKAARYEIVGIEDMMNKFSKHNVYSTQKILSVVSVSVKKLHGYGHLEEIAVMRRVLIASDARKMDHKESGKIGGCSGTRDGLQTDDTYQMIVRSNLKSYLVNNVNM
ncbi:hypothetical protein Tco_1420475 [Tanacetum coccineum]